MNATLTCRNQDHAATRLHCAGCGTPICPACLHRTEVGLKCAECARPSTADAAVNRRMARSRRAGALVIAAATAATIALVMVLLEHAGRPPAPDVDDGSTAVLAPAAATGDGWQLSARVAAEGRVCSTVRIGSRPAPENCEPAPAANPFGVARAASLRANNLLWVAVAPNVDHVEVATEAGGITAVPIGTGVARFVAAVVPASQDIQLAAVSAAGQTLARRSLPAPRLG